MGRAKTIMQDLSPEFSKILYWQVEVVEQMETAKAAMPHDSIYVRNQGKWCWWLLPSSWAPAHGSGVSIHELFSTSQDTWISPVCHVSLEEPFSRIDLFHFYNISALGQVMKQHVVYYQQQYRGCSCPNVFYSFNRRLLSTYYVSSTC